MPTTTRRTSSLKPSAEGSAAISRSMARSGSPSSIARSASSRSTASVCSRRMREARASAAKDPATLSRMASASSRSPRRCRSPASATAASARPGSSSSARRSDASSPSATSPSASDGTSASKKRATLAGGCRPTNSLTTRPSLNALTAGMPWIPNAREIDGFVSVSSLARTTWPSRAAVSFSRIGLSARHGPHHSAQKSTTTGVVRERSMTSRSKSCSVTSITAMGSKALERSGHRVIAYDARGHGRSDPAASPDAYEYADLVADLAGVLDERGLERAVLAGASMGAHTVLRFAMEYPERAAALVVITPAYDPVDHGDPANLARWDALSEGLRSGGVEGFVEAYGEPGVPERWRETVTTVLRQRLSAHDH